MALLPIGDGDIVRSTGCNVRRRARPSHVAPILSTIALQVKWRQPGEAQAIPILGTVKCPRPSGRLQVSCPAGIGPVAIESAWFRSRLVPPKKARAVPA